MSAFIIGASSGMGLALAHEHAKRGEPLWLVARDEEELQKVAADLEIRYRATVKTLVVDMAEAAGVQTLIKNYLDIQELPRLYLCAAAGTDYPDFLEKADKVQAVFQANSIGPIQFLNGILPTLAQKGEGEVVVFSSVAALKGKGNNPVYSATKAAVAVYAEGMRNAMKAKGVQVTTVFPGFIDTSQTFGMGKLPFLHTVEGAAQDVVRAVDKGRDVVFTKWIWRFVMLAFQIMPGFVYNKMSFLDGADWQRILGKDKK
ncbi:MAG: SDR family NAD(P)-dependent oxidoreductase [Alphaproteobacteria bacterium]|nr:SDR family NAD(P)-dependent oxidoreductase [Alphaproteobacteria bacterium]MDD9919661.1 SDR family NAD(P)-dependent oxidoreductase [Alphaproteobacteria bacterium]